ncbi:MAG: class I SAM-dependent methyltransferase [Bacilli bacterium]
MENKNLTSLISCFARAYHFKNSVEPILKDDVASRILTKEEYDFISKNMSDGILFFNPNFKGDNKEALDWIVNNQLAPSILGRSIFCETSLERMIKNDCKQYLIFASGYDTYAYRNNFKELKIFEIDKKEMIDDKILRLQKSNIDYTKANFIKCDFTKIDWIKNILYSNFKKNEKSFCSLLGIVYYLSKNDFENMLCNISKIISVDSEIIFDFPSLNESIQTKTNEKLASGANEPMKAKYSYNEIKNILQKYGFKIIKYLDDITMTQEYFYSYNKLNPNKQIKAPQGVCYCLAKKIK